jgi:hypothetical protein
MIICKCGNCGKTYQVDDKHAGKRTKCKKCEHIIVIPLVEQHENDTDNSSGSTRAAVIVEGQKTSQTSSNNINTSNKTEEENGKYVNQEKKLVSSKGIQSSPPQSQYTSNSKPIFYSFLGFVFLLCGLFFAGIFYYSHIQSKKTEELQANFEKFDKLFQQAKSLADQKEEEKALSIYESIKVQTLSNDVKNWPLAELLIDTDKQIKFLNDKIFVKQSIFELNKIKGEADTLFVKCAFDSASIKYKEIMSFIEDHKKQNDYSFKVLYQFSNKRIQIIKDLSLLLASANKNLNGENRQEVDKRYDNLIIYLYPLKKSSDEIDNTILKLQDLRKEAASYYDEEEKKVRLAELERQKQIEQERLQREALAKERELKLKKEAEEKAELALKLEKEAEENAELALKLKKEAEEKAAVSAKTIKSSQKNISRRVRCPACNGRGYILKIYDIHDEILGPLRVEERCTYCGGRGYVTKIGDNLTIIND